MSSNPFFDKHKAKLGVATPAPPPAAAAIASIAPPPPPVQPPPPVHEPPPPPPPATVPEEAPMPPSNDAGSDLAEIAARCVLPRPLAQQPKSSKRVICKPTYTADADVTRLGIQLSAGDGVPCAFYHSKSKRLVMGVTLLHALDPSGAVQTLNANSKDAAGKAAIAAAETALAAAFAAHGADAGLTYEALLKHAGLYGDAPGAEFLHVTYQTIERFINALPAPPPGLAAAAAESLPAAVAAAVPARRKRAPAAVTAAAVDAFDSDDDDAALLGVDVQHDRPRAAMDREAAEVAAELGLDGGDDDGAEPRAVDPLGGAVLPDDEDDDVLMAPDGLDADPAPPPVPPSPAKPAAKRKAPPAAARDVLPPPPKRARVDAAPPPAHANAAADDEETQFRRAMLFAAIRQHGSTLAGRALWDVLKKDIYCLCAAGGDAEEAEFVLAQVFAALSYDYGSGVRDDRQLWALIRRSLA